MHEAKGFDTLWGCGILRADNFGRELSPNLDIRAVRGPITKDYLLKKGLKCPDIFGDPAILLPGLFPEFKKMPQKGIVGLVPHFRNRFRYEGLPSYIRIIDPARSAKTVIQEILQCEFVISGSLHGIIVAEAFDIPARWFPDTGEEPDLKYYDYYASTNRSPQPAGSLKEAEKLGGESKFCVDAKKLLDAFPHDIRFDFLKK